MRSNDVVTVPRLVSPKRTNDVTVVGCSKRTNQVFGIHDNLLTVTSIFVPFLLLSVSPLFQKAEISRLPSNDRHIMMFHFPLRRTVSGYEAVTWHVTCSNSPIYDALHSCTTQGPKASEGYKQFRMGGRVPEPAGGGALSPTSPVLTPLAEFYVITVIRKPKLLQ